MTLGEKWADRQIEEVCGSVYGAGSYAHTPEREKDLRAAFRSQPDLVETPLHRYGKSSDEAVGPILCGEPRRAAEHSRFCNTVQVASTCGGHAKVNARAPAPSFGSRAQGSVSALPCSGRYSASRRGA